jgi:hypothetical protein
MKKLLNGSLLVLAVMLVLASCADANKNDDGGTTDPYAQYYSSDPNGTVSIINNTEYDMLLFAGEAIGQSTLVGGVRAGSTRELDVSDQSDYQVGGYMILRAVKQTEYNANKSQSRIDYSAMVTYGAGKKFRATIVSTTDGQYSYEVNNRTQYGLELRLNSPEGEKLAYLTRNQVRVVLNRPTQTPLTLYPVYVAFNNVTKSIITFSPTDILSPQDIQPKLPTDEIVPYYFPMGGTTPNITFDIKLPFATVFVRNNATMGATFRIGNQPKSPESNYQLITSGARETYEIKSDGVGLNLNLAMSNGQIEIPVRIQGENTYPILENGFVYNITLDFIGGDLAAPSSYSAALVKGAAINTADLVTAY